MRRGVTASTHPWCGRLPGHPWPGVIRAIPGAHPSGRLRRSGALPARLVSRTRDATGIA